MRKAKFAFDENALKPYLSLPVMQRALFATVERLYGLRFVRVEEPPPLYHPDVELYEVRDVGAGEEALVALFLHDNYARPNKQSGAWMSEFRGQSRNWNALSFAEDAHAPGVTVTSAPAGGDQLPIVINNNNFARGADGAPALLSFDDALTLFHEMGHGLHGMLSSVTYCARACPRHSPLQPVKALAAHPFEETRASPSPHRGTPRASPRTAEYAHLHTWALVRACACAFPLPPRAARLSGTSVLRDFVELPSQLVRLESEPKDLSARPFSALPLAPLSLWLRSSPLEDLWSVSQPGSSSTGSPRRTSYCAPTPSTTRRASPCLRRCSSSSRVRASSTWASRQLSTPAAPSSTRRCMHCPRRPSTLLTSRASSRQCLPRTRLLTLPWPLASSPSLGPSPPHPPLASSPSLGFASFEQAHLRKLHMPEGIVMRHRPPHFLHLFASSGYAAMYYVYQWAEVLDADAFDTFLEAGDVFDPPTAARLRKWVYSSGNSVEPGEAYRQFKGRDATVEPMMRNKGLLEVAA